mgnify:CR=1 FL=1
MAYQRFSDKIYNIILDQKKRDYIADNCYKFTDRQIGLYLGVHPHIVNGYRRDKLEVIKQRTLRKSIGCEPMAFFYAKQELKALKEFNYSGVMQDSVNKRIEFLEIICRVNLV